MHKVILVLVAVVFTLPTLASQPGHPLDCSDWVFSVPGLHCVVNDAYDPVREDAFIIRGSDLSVDNDGALYVLRQVYLPWDGNPEGTIGRLEIVRRAESTDTVVGSIQDRFHSDATTIDHARPVVYGSPNEHNTGHLAFDPVRGWLLIPIRTYCIGPSCSYGNSGYSIVAITGLTPLFEVLQTYTPTADALQFRVPAHPEGLRSADHFDTYWGHVSDLPDFTQAQPMQCHYPPTPPTVGDYLTVADTSPQPPPGAANYVVTAVTNGAQRRYGRKFINGVMSGRDPALLPGCP